MLPLISFLIGLSTIYVLLFVPLFFHPNQRCFFSLLLYIVCIQWTHFTLTMCMRNCRLDIQTIDQQNDLLMSSTTCLWQIRSVQHQSRVRHYWLFVLHFWPWCCTMAFVLHESLNFLCCKQTKSLCSAFALKFRKRHNFCTHVRWCGANVFVHSDRYNTPANCRLRHALFDFHKKAVT